MHTLDLSFACKESSLSTRHFRIFERINGLFQIDIGARSPIEDLDLEALIGQGAALRLGDEAMGFRVWTGIVSHIEQVEVEPDGLSRYHLRIVPELWRLTQRKNSRIFQHQSLLGIATTLLAEWKIVPVLELDPKSFVRLEYKVQYDETDFAFLSRILEEAGISYGFRDPGPGPKDVEREEGKTALVFWSDPARAELRQKGVLRFTSNEHAPSEDSIWHVHVRREVKPGRVTLRDYDFRSRPDVGLFAGAKSADALEERLEIYEYRPGAFLCEPSDPASADVHTARTDLREATLRADRELEGHRHERRLVTFHTNVLDLTPGAVFTMDGHPRRELARGRRLLATAQHISGERDKDWMMSGQAVFADEQYKPALATPRPKVPGVQSALVVGPAGSAIHTDETGRVRVQFHWDREGGRDQDSSCFVRVSQGWAGAGHGTVAIPRVGDEVLVGFFEGDPEQPVIVGRVYNSSALPPHKLPIHKTRSAWVGQSTPTGGGRNEIMLEDASGEELVYVHAERDMERIVEDNDKSRIGNNLTTLVGADESRKVEGDQTITVSGDRTVEVKGSSSTSVAESWQLDLAGGAGVVVEKSRRIVLTTGEASLVLDGPNLYIDAQAMIQLSGGDLVSLAGGEVHMDGRPNVYLNSTSAIMPVVASASALMSQLVGEISEEERRVEQAFDDLLSRPLDPGAAPDAVAPPAFVDEQLRAARAKIAAGEEQIDASLKSRLEMLDDAKKKGGENLVPKVEKARAEINALITKVRVEIEKVKADIAARIGEVEAKAKELEAKIKVAIAQAKGKVDEAIAKGKAIVDGIKQRIDAAKQQAREMIQGIKQRVEEIKTQVKQAFDDLRKRAIEVRNAIQSEIDQVKATIEDVKKMFKDIVTDFKETIADAKQTVKNVVDDIKGAIQHAKDEVKHIVGDFKSMVKDVKDDAKQLGQEAKKLADDLEHHHWKDAAKDGKQLGKDWKSDENQIKDDYDDIKGDAKSAEDQAKADAQQVEDDAKGGAQKVEGDVDKLGKDAKTDGQQALDDAKKAAHARSHHGGLGHGAPNLHDPTAKNGQNGHGLAAIARGGLAPAASLAKTAVVTRAGGFGAQSFASAINGTKGAAFLQSPSEGQLMVLRTPGAAPLEPQSLQAHVVDAQMNGMSSDEAYTSALVAHGYTVYERPYDSVGSEFVKKEVL